MKKLTLWSLIGGLAVSTLLGGLYALALQKEDQSLTQAEKQFRAAGKGASLTVLPTLMAGKSFPQVGEAVAMILERGGMTNLETSDVAFTPPDGADLAASAQAFAQWVKANPPATDYVLLTDFHLSRETGVTEVRGIVASKQGEIVWQDRQTKSDRDFKRISPREPLQCCMLMAERLRPVLKLDNPQRSNAPEGKITQRWRKRSGIPSQTELEAVAARGKVFKQKAAQSTLLVYPVHAGASLSPESAKNLAAQINAQKLANATAVEKGPSLEIPRTMNQQQVLWSMARGLSEHVKQNRPAADYVLFPQYVMGKDAVGGVNFAICNQQGELVAVEYHNSHGADFKAINPKTREECDKLVLRRLQALCK